MDRVLVNPIAGHGFAKRVCETVVDILKKNGVEFDVVYSDYAGHTVKLSREAALRGDGTLFLLGGDGSIIEAARGLYGSETALATLPCGTGNDFRKSLHIPTKVEDAVNYVLSRGARRIDCGFIKDADKPEILFMNESGTGFDVAALEFSIFSKRFLRGLSAYMYGVLRALVSFKAPTVEISIDGGAPVAQKITIFAVANGGWMGGGLEIAPMADPFDGYFDVVVIPELTRTGILRALPRLMNGTVMQVPGIKHYRCRECHIKGESLGLNIDGELMRISEMRYRIEPGGILVRA